MASNFEEALRLIEAALTVCALSEPRDLRSVNPAFGDH
jgi:hypothetical protein